MGSAEVLAFIKVDDGQNDPTTATGLTTAAAMDLNAAVNALPGFQITLIRPTGPVMPHLPGSNIRVAFRAPPENPD